MESQRHGVLLLNVPGRPSLLHLDTGVQSPPPMNQAPLLGGCPGGRWHERHGVSARTPRLSDLQIVQGPPESSISLLASVTAR